MGSSLPSPRLSINGCMTLATGLVVVAALAPQVAFGFGMSAPADGSAVTVENVNRVSFSGTCKSDGDVSIDIRSNSKSRIPSKPLRMRLPCFAGAGWYTQFNLSAMPDGELRALVQGPKGSSKEISLFKDTAPTMINLGAMGSEDLKTDRLTATGGCSKNGSPVYLTIEGYKGESPSATCQNNAWSIENIDLRDIDAQDVVIEALHVNTLTGETDTASFTVRKPETAPTIDAARAPASLGSARKTVAQSESK